MAVAVLWFVLLASQPFIPVHQVMPSTWSYYTIFRFGWSEAVVGASFAFVGLVMAASQATLPRLLVPRIGEALPAA